MKISDAKVWLTKKVLKENELFHNLEEPVLDSLIAHADAKLLAKDELLYHRGEAANDTFCIIIFGSVKIVGDTGHMIATLNRGNVMGEIGIMGLQKRRTADVVALEPTSILEWTFTDVKELSPNLEKNLQKLALTHLRNLR